MRRLLAAALFLAVGSAAAADVTCTGSVSEGAISLSCSGAPPVDHPPPPPPPPPPPAVTCASPTYTATFTSPGQFFEFSLATGQVAALAFPVIKPNGWVESTVFQSTATPSDLQAVGTISGQPGCISTTVPACTASGSAWSSIDLHGQVAPGYCPLAAGLVYYMNVTVTNCAQDRCTLRTQYWGGGQ